MIYNV